jgi:hypothetical protein
MVGIAIDMMNHLVIEGELMNKEKNLMNKTRPVENPYEVWRTTDNLWEWRILKKWQKPSKEKENPYARWFCAVKSPHTYDSWEYGDVYVAEVLNRIDTYRSSRKV